MSILKSSITVVAIVVGAATIANAAPRHHQAMQRTTVQPYTTELPGGQFEGNYSVPNSAVADDLNTRAAESFQDQFRNY
jgi:hypothetical protein